MFTIFGIKIANLTLVEVIDQLEQKLTTGQHLVVTANPEILVEAQRNQKYKQVMLGASLVVADGTGVVLASYLFGEPINKGRITGVDLVEAIIKNSSNQRYSVFIAGSTNEVLDKTTQYFSSKYTNINIVGYLGSDKNKQSVADDYKTFSKNLIEKIKQTKPDFLLLALGHPKQELWLAEHLPELPIKIAVGVGGTFDYLGGDKARAPVLLRRLGLEWFFRLIVEPRRIGRIITATVIFPAYVLLELFKKMFHMEHKV